MTKTFEDFKTDKLNLENEITRQVREFENKYEIGVINVWNTVSETMGNKSKRTISVAIEIEI